MSLRLPDPARVDALIREVAAREIMPRYQSLAAGDIREKAPGDFVTAADLASEAALSRRLPELLPGAVVLGEEAVAADASLYSLFDGDAPVWVIDPVDGTVNFAHARPGFAVIVALIQARTVRAGWILDPLAGVSVMAEQGGGAWSDGKRLRVSDAPAVGAMVGASYGRIGSATRTADLLSASGRVGGISNGMSSGIDYLALALGRGHFLVASHSKPWDHAAGILITRELGGSSGFIDGTPYDPRIIDRGVLSAASAEAWETIRAVIDAGRDRPAG
jgi:fructose-1,6-bisphosphatase/inositol monophosphatase family enzyme